MKKADGVSTVMFRNELVLFCHKLNLLDGYIKNAFGVEVIKIVCRNLQKDVFFET